MEDHDQRHKILLKEFFREFLTDFLAPIAPSISTEGMEWLDKEMFHDHPTGQRRYLDLVAKVYTRRPIAEAAAAAGEPILALILIEIASSDSTPPVKSQIYDYYTALRRKYGLSVLPVCVYLNVGLNGLGWDTYRESFGEHEILAFHYAYVGLPRLEAEGYIETGTLLAAAWSGLMKSPADWRVELRAKALQKILLSKESDQRRFLLSEALQAYSGLEEGEWQRLQELLTTPPYRETGMIVKTTYERGLEKGLEKGLQRGLIQGRQSVASMMLEQYFGPLSPHVKLRLEELTASQLDDVILRVPKARSLAELGLEGEVESRPASE